MRRASHIASLVVLAWTGAASAQPSVQIRMTAEPAEVSMDDTVRLRVEVHSEGSDSPEVKLPSLDAFDVIRRQVSHPMHFSFGFGQRKKVVRASSVYRFVLKPRAPGKHVIAPAKARVGGRVLRSEPVTVVVSGQATTSPPPADQPDASAPTAAPPAGDGVAFDRTVFLRTVVDKTDVFVGEQLTVTVYLYLRGSLHSAPVVEREPATDGFWVHDLLPASRSLKPVRQNVRGSTFNVYTLRRFAAFPLRGGKLTIGAMEVRIKRNTLFDLLSGARDDLERRGVPVEITAKPLPDQGQPEGEIAVGSFTLDAKLDREQVATGDAVTLEATVEGTGNIRTVQLPTPDLPGVQVFDPQIDDRVQTRNGLVGGSRVFEWLLVPRKPGEVELPPLQLHTFDPATGDYRTLTATPPALVAAGKALPDGATNAAADQPGDGDAPEAEELPLGPIRTSSELRRGRARLLDSTWYPWAVAAAPAAWLLLMTSTFVRRRLGTRFDKPMPKRVVQEAHRRLSRAHEAVEQGDAVSLCSAIAQALTEVLELKLGEPIGGYTRPQLQQRLQRAGVGAELARRLHDELERCDAARFGALSAGSDELAQQLERASELLRELQHVPIEQEKER